MYNVERKEQLKMVPHLTHAHIHPNNSEKMSMQLVVKVFSRRMSIALNHYREKYEKNSIRLIFKGILQLINYHVICTYYCFNVSDSLPTERLTFLLNNVFDVLNGRIPKEGITISNWHNKKKILDQMLRCLEVTEQAFKKQSKNMAIVKSMFVSNQTLFGWRLTINSVIQLTEELFNSGYSLVLTGKMNQDILEVCFY